MGHTTGKLVRWLDNKGFGFIKPEQGGSDIFIHISALKGMSRKPVVGDIIHYEISTDTSGKPRAVNAKIEGVELALTLEPIRKKHQKARAGTVKKRAYRKQTQVENTPKNFKLVLILIVIIGVALASFQKRNVDFTSTIEEPAFSVEKDDNQRLKHAYANRQSDVQVAGSGIVSRTLSDDTTGSQHQRFILRLASGQTLLIAHNIDLAPRIISLSKGDRVEFFGEYEWNSKGGVLHWTHNDPRGQHENGWLKHNGSTYQ